MSWEGILKRKNLHVNRGSYQPPSSSKTPYESQGLMQITFKVWPKSEGRLPEQDNNISTYVVEAEDVDGSIPREAWREAKVLVEKDFPDSRFDKDFHWEVVDTDGKPMRTRGQQSFIDRATRNLYEEKKNRGSKMQ